MQLFPAGAVASDDGEDAGMKSDDKRTAGNDRMTVNLAWSLWPQWIPVKAKEAIIVWLPNAATLIPPYFVMRILSADYTKRLFPNRWILGAIVLSCMNTIPWMTGQWLYWKAMSSTYAVASPLSRILSTWPF